MIEAATFRRILFLTRIPKGTGRFLMRQLVSLIYYVFTQKKKSRLLSPLNILDLRCAEYKFSSPNHIGVLPCPPATPPAMSPLTTELDFLQNGANGGQAVI
jgi:hypothetical protein